MFLKVVTIILAMFLTKQVLEESSHDCDVTLINSLLP